MRAAEALTIGAVDDMRKQLLSRFRSPIQRLSP
jgi:hypothetical protein